MMFIVPTPSKSKMVHTRMLKTTKATLKKLALKHGVPENVILNTVLSKGLKSKTLKKKK